MKAVLLALVTVALVPASVRTQCLAFPVATLVPPVSALDDTFGAGHAAQGDTVVIQAGGTGELHVFRHVAGSWQHEQLIASPLVGGEGLTFGVGLDGDVLAAAEFLVGTNRLHLWRRQAGSFVFEQSLVIPSTETSAGIMVDVSGERVVTSSLFDDEAWVYAYDGAAWSLEATLTAPGGTGMGPEVALHGDVLVVGGSFNLLHVFERQGGAWVHTLLPEPVDDDLYFAGGAMDFDGEWLMYNLGGLDTPYDLAFRRFDGASWSAPQVIDFPHLDGGSFLWDGGQIDGELAVNGDHVLRLVGDEWVVEHELRSDVPGVVSGAGGAALVEGLVLGGYWEHAVEQGWVHVFDPGTAPAADCLPGDGFVDACAVALGASPDDDRDGNPDVCQEPWLDIGPGLAGGDGVPRLSGFGPLVAGSTAHLRLVDAAPDAPAHLVLGLSLLGAPLKGGVLWPSADVLLSGAVTDGDGDLLLSAPWPAGVFSGFQSWWQWWVEDPGAVKGVAASNGLQATAP